MGLSRRCLLVATCINAGTCPAQAADPAVAPDGPVEVDIAHLAAGQLHTVQWKGKPVWVLHRPAEVLRQLESPDLLARLADPHSARSAADRTPAYARNSHRSIRPEVFVGIAVCPHAGCIPVPRLAAGPRPGHPENWPGGFACQCHFATFDLAGRVFKDKPTDENIEIPRHMYLAATRIVIGRDQHGEA